MEDMTAQETPTYSGSVASKKILWAIGKFIAAELTTILTAPALIAMAGKVTTAAGIPPEAIPLAEIHAILPVAIFACLVAIHDAVKVKTGWEWL